MHKRLGLGQLQHNQHGHRLQHNLLGHKVLDNKHGHKIQAKAELLWLGNHRPD
jgi:hypothetical protein